MRRWTMLLTLAVSVLLIPKVGADCFTYSYYYHSYYYPVEVYYPVAEIYSVGPVYHVQPPVCPVQTIAVPAATAIYAQPKAAPPSKKKAKTKGSKAKSVSKNKGEPPQITESRSFRKPPALSKRVMGSSRGQVKVGFWNITGRDIVLRVDGQRRRVPRNRAVTLSVGRSFDWQIDDESLRHVEVPVGRSSYEIVIRNGSVN